MLSSASRPARRVYGPRPAGRPDSVCVLAAAGCLMLLYWLRFWPAGRLLGWLAGWLCLLDVFVHILQYSTQLYSTNTVQYSTVILFSLQYSRVLLILHWCVLVVHWVSFVFFNFFNSFLLVLLMCSLFSLVLLGFLIDFHLLSATSKSLVF